MGSWRGKGAGQAADWCSKKTRVGEGGAERRGDIVGVGRKAGLRGERCTRRQK